MFNHSATSPRVFLSWRGRFPFKDFSFLRVRHLTPFPCECVFVVAVAFFRVGEERFRIASDRGARAGSQGSRQLAEFAFSV